MNKEIVYKIEEFIKDYVFNKAHSKGVTIGMSGGKDSLIVAKLCAEAIGKENVLGVIIPNGKMKDCKIAKKSCEIIGIRYYLIDINTIYNLYIDYIKDIFEKENVDLSTVTTFNLPPRIRMTLLYSIAGSMNYLVANTSNLSEKEVGYTTKWGDNVGDFGPIVNFTKSEVCQIGLLLGLPEELVNKTPADGLSSQTDEDKLGFSYSSLDRLIREGKSNEKDYEKILRMHKASEHKRKGVTEYKNDLYNFFENEFEDERE